MSRSGFTDDCDDDRFNGNAGWMYMQTVANAINGRRGQALLRETLEALDAMPVKELAADSFEADGMHCTLGVVGARRGLSLSQFMDDDVIYSEYTTTDVDARALGEALNAAPALLSQIMFENDDDFHEHWRGQGLGRRRPETPSERWQRMRNWIASNIRA